MRPACLALAKRVAMATLFVYGAACSAQGDYEDAQGKIGEELVFFVVE